MFRKNPLVELELEYLRQNRPHQKRHYFMLALALLVASATFFHLFTRIDGMLVQAMAFVILSVYWFVQWLMMRAAVVSANHELPDEMLGSYSNRQIISAKLRAVLRHYRGFILLISLAALGLSLVLMGYFDRIPPGYGIDYFDGRGLLTYIGLTNFTVLSLAEWKTHPILPHPLNLSLGFAILLSFTFTNTIFGTSLGILFKRIRSAVLLRLIVSSIVFGLFWGLFVWRETNDGYFNYILHANIECDYGNEYGTNRSSPDECNEVDSPHALIRVIESLQESSFSFFDNGTSLVTAFLCPRPVFEIDHYTDNNQPRYRIAESIFGEFGLSAKMIRSILAGLVGIIAQFGLSALLLWRTSRSMGKKKK